MKIIKKTLILIVAKALPVLNSNINCFNNIFSINRKYSNSNHIRINTKLRKNAVLAKYLIPYGRNYSTTTYSKKWNDLEYKLDNPNNITKPLITNYINKFWNDVMAHVKKEEHIIFIFRVKFINNQIASISNIKRINIVDKESVIQYLMDRINVGNENYNTTPISSIIFSYGIRDGKVVTDFSHFSDLPKFQIYYNNKLPIPINALNKEEYGKIIHKMGNHYTITSENNAFIILENVTKNKINTNHIQYFKNNILSYKWTDRIIDEYSFIREIGKSSYHYTNRELILMKVIKKSNPIKKSKVSKSLNNRFITMDLETILINNIHTPYLLCWTDGVVTKSYFIDSLDPHSLENNILEMVNKAMEDICIRKYKNYKVYFHNFSKFDGYFLVKYLSKLGFCDPIINDGKIISLNFLKFNCKYDIIFRDSYLLLPSSLRKLGVSFNIISQKGIFPYIFDDINHSGLVPDFKYFSKITKEEYNLYKNSFTNKIWDFKIESIKYCELDCISLYQILTKFNNLIFNKFSLNINNYPTLPGLSFAIFRSHYLQEDKNSIHMLSGDISKDIRTSYTGGAVDMYIPKPLNSMSKIYGYDVNSLYAFIMNKFKMPIGNPTYFKGDITKIQDNPFGFFFCKITAPNDLKHPIIQTHIKTKDGTRTVAPLGTWNDMLFSEEIYNAMKFGYKFEILWGYTFDSGFVFTDFINDLYKLRLDYPKSDPMNLIAKLIMNSLYGRFGMNDNFLYSYIMSSGTYLNFENKFKDSILDVIEIGDNYLVQVNKSPSSELNTTLDNGSERHDVNVAVASAISAYARIHMSQFKNNKNYNLYYSDTDSIYIDKPLANSFISNTELGKLKLEKICTNSVFLAPKVYGLRDENGNEIIKVKGLTQDSISNLNVNTLSELLNKDQKFEFNQNRWFRSISAGNISVKDQVYTLKVTGNKRKLIYLKYIAYHFTDNVKVVVINKI